MKRESSGPKGAPQWMVTYSDVISLLVTFFVMLLTFSTSNDEKFDRAVGSLRGALGVSMTDVSRLPQTGMLSDRYLISGRSTPIGMDMPAEFGALDTATTRINQRLMNDRRGVGVTLRMLRRGVLLRMDSVLIFVPGTARFAPDAHDYLAQLLQVIGPMRNTIEITSHVGPEVRGGACPWSLSQEQAAAIAEFLHREAGIPPSRIAVSGMGNSTPSGRRPAPHDSRIEMLLPKLE